MIPIQKQADAFAYRLEAVRAPAFPKPPAAPKPPKLPGSSPVATPTPDDDDDMVTLYRGIKFPGRKYTNNYQDKDYAKQDQQNQQDFRDKIEATHKNPSSIGPMVQKSLGNHWTPNIEAAHQFASNDDAGYTTLQDNPKLPYKYDVNQPAIKYNGRRLDKESEDSHGLVISAKFHKKDIIDPNSAEGRKYADAYEIYGGEGFQNEHTIRNGTPVKVDHAYYTSNTSDEPRPALDMENTHSRTVRTTEIDPSTFHQHYVAKLKFM